MTTPIVFSHYNPNTPCMDSDADTCRVCGNTLSGIERKRGTCTDCSDGSVTK